MSANTAAIQQLYVAYFNRPADFSGLAFWEGVVEKAKGSTAAVSAAFAGSDEYKATYAGLDAAHVVDQIYHNLFNRGPDIEGLNFWTQRLLNKDVTIDNVVATIAAAAKNEDKVTITNKVAAATAFSAALDTPAEALGYAGDKANGIAKQWLSNVGSDASLAVAVDKAALDAVIQNVVDNGPQPVGQTYNLGLGQDIINGTTGNDIINAYSFNAVTGEANKTTLSTFDTIDGGAGKDTLNLSVTDTANVDATTHAINAGTKNVEIINIDESGSTAAVAVDASMFAGATLINQMGKAGEISKLAVGTTAGFQGVTADMSVKAAGASAAVLFNNVGEAAHLQVQGTTLAAVTVSGTRADTNGDGSTAALQLNVIAGKNVQAVTVTSNAKTTLTVAEEADTAVTSQVTSVDASASTGAITFSADADVVAIKTGAGNDSVTITGLTAAATSAAAAVNATVSTGDGKDTIVISTTGDGSTSVDAGAGDDTITVNKAASTLNVQGGAGNDTITINGVLSTSDVVNGGDGSDTVAVLGKTSRTADDYIVFNKLITGFEAIKFTTAEGALDASKLAATYATIDLADTSVVTKVGAQALVAHGALTATAAGFVADAVAGNTYAGSLNLTEKASGNVTANADVVSLTVKATTDTAATATAPAVSGDVDAFLKGEAQTVNVTLTNAVNASSNATADTIATVIFDNTANDGDVTSVKLSGNGTAFVTNVNGGSLTSVDASALGGTFTLGANAGAAIDGLIYDTFNTKAETIKLGAGIDWIKLEAGASTYGKVDAISGLHLVANTAGTDVTAASDHLTVVGATGAVKFTTTQTDLDLALKDAAVSTKGQTLVFNMGGDTYVYHDGGVADTVDAADIVVKIVGGVDLDALVAALH
jgi:hypothetical protein